jgi:adenine/guanine phosphoribosyltransferase-like PRPP-binding protein
VGLDARGFLLGPIIAMRLGAAFVPVRKKGKLPGECVTASYEKEYGVVSTFPFYLLTAVVTVIHHFVGLFRDASGRHQARPIRRCCR